MSWSRASYLHVILLACFVLPACAYEPPSSQGAEHEESIDLDRPESFDIYVDATGPTGFFVQTEHQAAYTSHEEYEAAAPSLYAQAAQAGLPLRFVFGPKLQGQKTANLPGDQVTPQWTQTIERWGFVVSISSPSYKYVSGCVGQNAYAANLRIHSYLRGVDTRGTQLRDYHLAGYRNQRDDRLCIGLVETETRWPNWCDCPGRSLRDAYSDLIAGIRQALQDSGMTYSQAVVLAAALAPMVVLAFAPVGL